MYVNPVLLGVVSTIMVEIIACVVWAFVLSNKDGKRK